MRNKWFLPLVLVVLSCAAPAQLHDASRRVGMTLAQAQELLRTIEAGKPGLHEPLREPESLDQVLDILKRDQLDLFPSGVRFAETLTGTDAIALRGQIELAWGEDQLILANLLGDIIAPLKTQHLKLRTKEASGGLTPEEVAEKEAVAARLAETEDRIEALTKLSAEHVGTGAELARKVIEASPDNYLGYRLLADYYRMRLDWTKFEEMLKRLEATKPDSNGLLFLRGVAALERDGAPAAAAELLRQSIERDPDFVRAQAHLVLVQSKLGKFYEEYKRLEHLNPQHQIVVWAGEAIRQAHEG